MAIRLRVLLLVVAVAGVLPAGAQSAGGKRPVSVEDMIRMTTIDGDEPWGSGVVRPAVFSHDGSRFAFVIHRADLARNTNISSIILVQAKDVFGSAKPDTLVSFASSSSRPGITSVQWLPGDTGLVFIGERPGELAQIWAVNVASRATRRLSNGKASISLVSLAPAGGRLLYIGDQAPDSAKNEDRAARGFFVTQEVRDLLSGKWDVATDQDEPKDMSVLSIRDGRTRGIAAQATGDCYANGRFSSTGRFAIDRCIRRDTLADWKAYIPPGTPIWRMGSVDILIDLDRARADRLLDLPAVGKPAEWSPNGTDVLVTNSLLPLSGVDDAERAARRGVRAAVIVDAQTRAVHILVRRDSLELARWGTNGQAVVLRSMGADKTELAFRRDANRWIAAEASSVPEPAKLVPANAGLEVFVEEDLNTPPRVVATQNGKRAVVLDPNREFSRLALAREDVFRWKTTDGEWVGGLYYPVGYVSGKRYPLVIQTHGFSLDRFQIAGYGVTGYAGQALAGSGIMVLQVGDGPRTVARSVTATKEENPFNVRAFEAAIDTLDRLGLIDRNKVALEGWSRTTFHVRSMLVNSSYPIAAALISDGYDAGYVRWVINTQAHTELEAITGGPPIGEQLRAFQELIPTMRPDRIKAPIRIESIGYPGGGGPLTQWEFYQFLRRLNKPVEMIYYPRGEHSLQRPWERMTSQGGAFDWFRFWLTGEEDPSPAKAEQYKRWRAMRAMTEATMK